MHCIYLHIYVQEAVPQMVQLLSLEHSWFSSYSMLGCLSSTSSYCCMDNPKLHEMFVSCDKFNQSAV